MEEKKKFVKPSMQVVELKSKVNILAGSGCDPDECTTNGSGSRFTDFDD